MNGAASSGRRGVLVLAAGAMLLGALVPAARAADPAPLGIHVSLGADARTTATIAWHTAGLSDPGTVAEWGTTSSLGSSSVGTGAPAPESVPVVLHEVVLRDLPADSEIFYRVGSGSGWSETRSFRTGPEASRFRFTVFGDHGTRSQSIRTTALVQATQPNFHLIAGDLSYANSRPEVWNTWFEQTEALFATTPVMSAPGNHETETTQTGNGAATYLARFALPQRELFYGFDYGRVHFSIFHSTYDADPVAAAEALAFLEDDLRAAAARRDAGELDFLVVVQHHPLWANAEDADLMRHYLERRTNPPLIAAEEQMLVRHGVDLLIAGHNHHYERTKPMAYGVSTDPRTTGYEDPNGYIQIITGGGGASLYDFRDPADFPEWSAAYARRFHFVQVDVDGDLMTATTFATDAPVGEVLDTWTLRAR